MKIYFHQPYALYKHILLCLTLSLLSASVLYAQEVAGTVMDIDGNALPGVSVLIKGTAKGSLTNSEGKFNVIVENDEATLVFSFIGYETQEVPVNGQREINISLVEQDVAMDEIVITALGIERDKLALGYAIQEVKGEELGDVRESNFVNLLSGKVAGVNIAQGGTGMTGSAYITIRGQSSLRNNAPLMVVDGTPVSSNFNGNGSDSYDQRDLPVDFGNGTADINPDDIESITVLKGASAAALYGSRAANGVLLITTKSGKQSKGIGVTVNSSFTMDDILRLPDFQYTYGAGVGTADYYAFEDEAAEYGGRPATSNSGQSRGPRLDQGQSYVQYGSPRDENGNRIPIPWVTPNETIEDYFETGKTFSNNVSIAGANDLGNFRLSYTNLSKTGILPNTDLSRNTVSFSGAITPNDKLTVRTNINYVLNESDNIQTPGYGSSAIMYSFIWWEPNAPLSWFKDYWEEGKEDIEQAYMYGWADNPYLVAYEHLNGFEKNRIFGNISASYQFTDRLSLMLRSGIDYYGDKRTFQRPWSTVYYPRGRYREQDIFFTERNTDFLLKYDQPINEDWQINASVGGNLMVQKGDELTVTANELAVPGVYDLGNAAGATIVRPFESEKRINSLYGLAQISFKNAVFLDVTGRNDWSSTLGLDNTSYFYPSVSLSTVINRIVELPEVISFAKVRANWGQTGNDADPFLTNRAYNYGVLSGSVTNQRLLTNSGLVNELSESFEVGADIRFFNNRLGFDLTYYKINATNQILPIATTITAGVDARWENAGELQNEGVEVLVNAVPISLDNGFRWTVDVNFTANENKVISLVEGTDILELGQCPYGACQVIARVGGNVGELYGVGWKRVEGGQYDGQIIHNESGIRIKDTEVKSWGDYNPDWTGGIYNNFYFKDFHFGFLVDHRQGGQIYSYTYATGDASGVLDQVLYAYDENFVSPGVIENPDGTYRPNDVTIGQARGSTYFRSNRDNVEENTFENTFTKLREVRLGYTFPRKLTNKLGIQKLSLSLIGRNLVLWTDVPHIDPEAVTVNGANSGGVNVGGVLPGVEVSQIPSTRSYGLNLNLQF